VGKSKRLRYVEPRMKPTMYISSADFRIPKDIRGKVGKNVTLTVKGKIISQRLSREPNRKQIESYDLEISKIKSGGNRRGKRT